MAKLPIFGAGQLDNVVVAVSDGRFTYPSYVYVRDQKKLGFVDRDGSFNLIVGDNEPQIVKVEALPEVSEAKTDMLYIVGEAVYLFNGEEFKQINAMDTSEIEALTERIEALETAIADKVSAEEVDAKVEAKVEESVNTVVDEKVNAKVDEVIDEKVSESVDNSEKITALETSNQELTTKVSELEEAIAALEENSAPSFIELD